MVAAVTGPLQLAHGSWLAAYLVLVGGVAQYVIGRAPTWFGPPTSPRSGWFELAGWNLGNLGVAAGTLTAVPILVDIGGVLLLIVLVLLLRDTLGRRDGAPPASLPQWTRWTYVVMLIVLVVSVPVGLVLAQLRAG